MSPSTREVVETLVALGLGAVLLEACRWTFGKRSRRIDNGVKIADAWQALLAEVQEERGLYQEEVARLRKEIGRLTTRISSLEVRVGELERENARLLTENEALRRR